MVCGQGRNRLSSKCRILCQPNCVNGIGHITLATNQPLSEALCLAPKNLTLIGLWDGEAGDGRGGTRHMVSLASALNYLSQKPTWGASACSTLMRVLLESVLTYASDFCSLDTTAKLLLERTRHWKPD